MEKTRAMKPSPKKFIVYYRVGKTTIILSSRDASSIWYHFIIIAFPPTHK